MSECGTDSVFEYFAARFAVEFLAKLEGFKIL